MRRAARRETGHELPVVRHSVSNVVVHFGDIVEEAHEFIVRYKLRDRVGLGLESLTQQHLYPTLLCEQLCRAMLEESS